MEHLIEISGCIDIPEDVDKDTVIDGFIEWVESNNWRFGGSFREIIDEYYINNDGTKGEKVE